MRDNITINELDEHLKTVIGSVSNMYTKEEMDSKINGLTTIISDVSNRLSDIDMDNVYNKSETDILITRAIGTAILDHNTNIDAHSSIQLKISNLTQLLSSYSIAMKCYTIHVTDSAQTIYIISDETFIPTDNISSILIWNTTIITKYVVSGRNLILDSGIPVNSNLTLIVFYIEGSV